MSTALILLPLSPSTPSDDDTYGIIDIAEDVAAAAEPPPSPPLGLAWLGCWLRGTSLWTLCMEVCGVGVVVYVGYVEYDIGAGVDVAMGVSDAAGTGTIVGNSGEICTEAFWTGIEARIGSKPVMSLSL